eukprot:TRINITY_DN297_c0_g1_i2.p1 TRINITY_DN297_c0_g1~~TRINITY_DN297_c0_g1_i2.p1  ORF type:complete len:343 (+),score=21.75 TRINITY_DN297_c0_g1_i2:154-1182(+)
MVGSGSFGVVFQARHVETGEIVAIKKVLQDKRYKNRELQMMRLFDHCNVVKLKHCFYSNGDKRQGEVYLNVVMEFVPDSVFRVVRHYHRKKQAIPLLFVKLYSYQIFRGLAYIHSLGVCHRDVKPQNIIVDPKSGVCKLCDFGSAKILVKGEPNISYICSRYYRAPELIFGATDYDTSIDAWSAGCVVAELLLGHPIFPGATGVDQLVEIIKVLGTPTLDEMQQMNKNYEFKFPLIKPHPWEKVFRKGTPTEALDLLAKVLRYTPLDRLTCLEALAHPFFDDLRIASLVLPNNLPPPPLFNFTPEELSSASPDLVDRLLPPHTRSAYDELCRKQKRTQPKQS